MGLKQVEQMLKIIYINHIATIPWCYLCAFILG